MASEIEELIGFLKAPRDDLRLAAVTNVVGLTGIPDGVDMLVTADAAQVLTGLVGDPQDPISSAAVTALVNLADRPKALAQMLQKNLVNRLMEGLKDSACSHKRLNVMLLANLSQSHAGCVQLLGLHEEESVLVGLHLRRLVQWFVKPVDPKDVGTARDSFEYAGHVIRNLSQMKEARGILLEKERGILPALLPGLSSPSAIRRRGVAGILRNCCFDLSQSDYLLDPKLGLVTALTTPLAGPESHKPDDMIGMPVQFYELGAAKKREGEADIRQLLVETLLLLTGKREGREELRRLKVYPVVRNLHEWVDAECRPKPEPSSASTDIVPAASTSAIPAVDDEPPLGPEDDATVEAIIKMADMLLREEESDGGAGAGAGAGASAGVAEDVAAALDGLDVGGGGGGDDGDDDDDDDDDDEVGANPRVEEVEDDVE